MVLADNVINFSDYKKPNTMYIDAPLKSISYVLPLFIPFVGWIYYKVAWEVF